MKLLSFKVGQTWTPARLKSRAHSRKINFVTNLDLETSTIYYTSRSGKEQKTSYPEMVLWCENHDCLVHTQKDDKMSDILHNTQDVKLDNKPVEIKAIPVVARPVEKPELPKVEIEVASAERFMQENFFKDERVALFIEGHSIYRDSRNLDFNIKYDKLHALFNRNTRLIQANYYVNLLDSEEYSPLVPLVDWLGFNGYSVNEDYVSKPASSEKIDNHVELRVAVDAMILAQTGKIDHMVLFSGYPNYTYLIKNILRMGIKVTVVSTKSNTSNNSVVSSKLRQAASRFIDYQDLKHYICE